MLNNSIRYILSSSIKDFSKWLERDGDLSPSARWSITCGVSVETSKGASDRVSRVETQPHFTLSVPNHLNHFLNQPNQKIQSWADAEKEERFVQLDSIILFTFTYNMDIFRDSEREELSVTGKSCAITFRVSPSPLFVVLLAVVVSSVSLVWSTRRLVVFSRPSLKMWAIMSKHWANR